MPDRIVRAGIITSDAVNKLSWAGEVLYRRLHSIVDDYGRYDARDSILRATLYPLKLEAVRESDVATWKRECAEAGLVRLYSVQGRPYLEVLKFDQRLRAKNSKWPSPDGNSQTSADICQHPPAIADKCIGYGDGNKYGTGSEGAARARAGIPTIDECRDLAPKIGLPFDEAEKFWRKYNAVGWINGAGIPIANGLDQMHVWKSEWERRSFESKKNEKINAPSINSIAQADSVIQECKKQIQECYHLVSKNTDGSPCPSHTEVRPECVEKLKKLKQRIEDAKNLKAGGF